MCFFEQRRSDTAYTLSYKEFIELSTDIDIENLLNSKNNIDHNVLEKLYEHFQFYLCHGGYLTAINDIAANGKILESTLEIYAEWIRGDIQKQGKQENYLREIIEALIKRYGSQLSWNALADAISIDHPNTVADYCHLLESMDALFIQPALLEDKLTAAPKKARKMVFKDPFIFHALRYWIWPTSEPYKNQIQQAITDPTLSAQLVEACVSTHFRRYFQTYYIKAAGEIDVAYIDKGRFWPIEVKWRNKLRPKDVKQIAKYKNARILSRTTTYSEIQKIPIEPLPLALLELNQEVLLE